MRRVSRSSLAAFGVVAFGLGVLAGACLWRVLGDRAPDAALTAVAHEIGALVREFDAERHDALFGAGSAAGREPSFTWLRGQLGECRLDRVMHRSADLQAARYLYACERGEFEAEFRLDAEGLKVRSLRIGARDKEPPAAVRAAAEAALALIDGWEPGRFERTFGASFEPAEMERFLAGVRDRWGACRIDGVDLAGHSGALLDLACERGERLMIVDLADDGRIRRFVVTARRTERGG